MDDVFAARPVIAKLFSQGVTEVHDVIRKAMVPLWILSGLAAVLAFL